MSDVSRRVRAAIEQARVDAVDRRARAEVAGERARQFLESTVTTVARQVASVLKSEGFLLRVSTPAGAVRLVLEGHQDNFIEFAVDTMQDPVSIMTQVSRARGRQMSSHEGPLRPEVPIDRLSDEDILEFLIRELSVFVER